MIYLDYNATTPLCEPARNAMLPYLETHFGNPSSVHAAGREARAAIDDARDQLAALLHAKPHELVFTAGGTEANNLAVVGLARAQVAKGRHIICSQTEHHAVLHAFEHLQKREGFEVTFLPVDGDGVTDLDELTAAIRSDTTLVSIMSANNETGVIQPLQKISDVCRARGVLLHSDMVQSFGKLGAGTTKNSVIPSEAEGPSGGTREVAAMKASRHSTGSLDSAVGSARDDGLSLVDAASFAAHKFYGPKGAGLLFLRAGIPIEPIAFGGAHENQRRPGTENVAAIAGMSAAAEWTMRDCAVEQIRERELRDRLWRQIEDAAPNAMQNGAATNRLANTLNVSFPGVSSETMLMALDLEGLCASSGSACMVGSVVASHVLLAMGAPPALASAAIRFSLGKQTTAAEIERAGDVIGRVVARLSQTYAAA